MIHEISATDSLFKVRTSFKISGINAILISSEIQIELIICANQRVGMWLDLRNKLT